MTTGSLTVVGTGYGGWGRVTIETCHCIESADKVFYLTADRRTADWVRATNPSAESLADCYEGRPDRLQSYLAMVERLLAAVRSAKAVCAVFYGHPGVVVIPSHEAVVRAREEGFAARMLPAISAEDCLYADLGVDPGRRGCQTYEATDFLMRRRSPDPEVPLVLWQAGSLGQIGPAGEHDNLKLPVLASALGEVYGPGHGMVAYEAAAHPGASPTLEPMTVADLAQAGLTPMTTLYVPPLRDTPLDAAMGRRLGLPQPPAGGPRRRPTCYDVLRPYGLHAMAHGAAEEADLLRYPRTRHLEGSRFQPGDTGLAAVPFAELRDRQVVVEEKLDGANVGISFERDGTLVLQNRWRRLSADRDEAPFGGLPGWAAAIRDELWRRLGSRHVLFGEWLQAKHTLFYDALPGYFCAFDVHDRRGDRYLTRAAREDLMADLVPFAPVRHVGTLSGPQQLAELVARSAYRTPRWRLALREAARAAGVAPSLAWAQTDGSDLMEGLYLRVEDGDRVVARYKWVRSDYRALTPQHARSWDSQPIIANRLACG